MSGPRSRSSLDHCRRGRAGDLGVVFGLFSGFTYPSSLEPGGRFRGPVLGSLFEPLARAAFLHTLEAAGTSLVQVCLCQIRYVIHPSSVFTSGAGGSLTWLRFGLLFRVSRLVIGIPHGGRGCRLRAVSSYAVFWDHSPPCHSAERCPGHPYCTTAQVRFLIGSYIFGRSLLWQIRLTPR